MRPFTLFELLMVIAVIAILTAMLFPALGKARATVRKIECVGVLRGYAIGFVGYLQDNNGTFDVTTRYHTYHSGFKDGAVYPSYRLIDYMGTPYKNSYNGYWCPDYSGRKKYEYIGPGNCFGVNWELRWTDVNYYKFKNPSKRIFYLDFVGLLEKYFDKALGIPGYKRVAGIASSATQGSSRWNEDMLGRHGLTVNVLYADAHVESHTPLQVYLFATDPNLNKIYLGGY